jgi:hypothetical protein
MDPRIRARLAVLTLLAASGCYSPSPAPGSYRCSAADNACPSGQHCTCGLCVKSDDQAACSFKLTPQAGVGGNAVEEHQPFGLTVQALMADGQTPAANFNGTVILTSSWGDVHVMGGHGPSATVQLVGGQAQATVTLNRETLPPQAALLTASFAGNKGTSAKVAVRAPSLARAATAVVDAPSAAQPFGFADVLVAQPDVGKSASGWRMYFGGLSSRAGYMFGVAQSSDGGATFTPLSSTPVFAAGGAAWDNKAIGSPSVFSGKGTINLAFAGSDVQFNGINQLGIATSPDGVMPFALDGTMPSVRTNECGYCSKGLDFPSVIPDPAAPAGDGGAPTAWLMFFSASDAGVSIGRASSSDGLHFTPEPAPLLSGDLAGEAVLLSPRVMVDGTVFKMWYSFARLADYKSGDYCASNLNVGYATSDDGFYWIRSPSNPVMPPGGAGWDAAVTAFLVGSVVPTDGADPGNGISLYYSTWRPTVVTTASGPLTLCLPNGIGRATRR